MVFRYLAALLFVASTLADCPSGTFYDDGFDKCYKYVSTPATFLAAESACQSIGGHLVTIQTGFENSFVIGMARGSGNVWIGYSYLTAASWSWTSGQTSTFINFASGQPSDPSTSQCTQLRDTDNKWTKISCNTALPYVCSVDPNAPVPPPANCPPQPSPSAPTNGACGNVACSSGYQLFNGTCRCYKFDPVVRSFKAGKAACQADGAMVVKITSAELNAFLMQLYGNDASGPWIGLNCMTTRKGSCTWEDGTYLSGYSNFYPGMPVSPNNNGVMFMIDNGLGDGQWYSYYQGQDQGSIFCEKPATRSSMMDEQPRSQQSLNSRPVVGSKQPQK